MWDSSLEGKYAPLNIDKRFILLRGSSGFYSYAIYEHLQHWPGFELGSTRLTFKLRKDKFQYMALSDNRQRIMPMPDDRMPARCRALAYPEAVILENPIFSELRGEVDDKYQYSCVNKDNKVHGWISLGDSVGFWQITASDEFRTGGPLKQNLTSHVGPTTLAIFHSSHYGGKDLMMIIKTEEYWKKVLGPVYIYLNSSSGNPYALWEDAKRQMQTEVENWPYSFPSSNDYEKAAERGNVRGKLLIRDKNISEGYLLGRGAHVGLALPGNVGSWQRECKGYQFWTVADDDGCFKILNIRSGEYNLYAWVPGFIGDYKLENILKIMAGSIIDVGDLLYEPPRDGPTLWEIGFPDRSAAEFFVPEPLPSFVNKLYINHPDKFRQYGLWDRYTDIYPNGDLVYDVASSDWRRDWFFAQVVRRTGDAYVGTTWQIKFDLERVNGKGPYKLRVAVASATLAELQVRVNEGAGRPLFSSGLIGRDNSIARHGIHGLCWLFNVDVPCNKLRQGANVLFLTQPRCTSPFQGIMYDYIRFEAPAFD